MHKVETGAGPVYSRHADDPDYAELLEPFALSLPEKEQDLRRAFETGELRTVQMLAHQLKGAGGGYGFEGLTTRAAALEQACKAEDRSTVAGALEELTAYLGRIRHRPVS